MHITVDYVKYVKCSEGREGGGGGVITLALSVSFHVRDYTILLYYIAYYAYCILL